MIEPWVESVIEPLIVVVIGPDVWVVEGIHLLVELVIESSVVVGAGPDVWVVEAAAGTEDWAEAAESGPGVLLVPVAASGCVFGTGPAAGVGSEAEKEAEDGLGVVVAIGEVFELASEAEGDAEVDAEPVNIAEIEAGNKAGDTAVADVGAVPET